MSKAEIAAELPKLTERERRQLANLIFELEEDAELLGECDRRANEQFLKLYEEERELPVRIFLDASESMTFGEPRKFDFARQVAAAVGYVALCGFDRVSVIPFPNPLDNGQTDPAKTMMERAARGALRSVRGRKSAL